MFKSSLLASAIAAISTTESARTHAHPLALSTSDGIEYGVSTNAKLVARMLSRSSPSDPQRSLRQDAVPSSTTVAMLRRQDQQRRALQQNAAGSEVFSIDVCDAEVASLKEALLSEMKRMEETIADPQGSGEDAGQFYERCYRTILYSYYWDYQYYFMCVSYQNEEFN